MSLRLGIWPQLLAERCELLSIAAPQERPGAERVEALKLRAWEVERTISSPHSEDLEGDALIWLVSKYVTSVGGAPSFTAAWKDLAEELWTPSPPPVTLAPTVEGAGAPVPAEELPAEAGPEPTALVAAEVEAAQGGPDGDSPA